MKERPAGVEPARPPWQGDRLPLHHGRLVGSRIVKDPLVVAAFMRLPLVVAASMRPLEPDESGYYEPEHREGLEPSSPHYGCGVLAAGRPVLG